MSALRSSTILALIALFALAIPGAAQEGGDGQGTFTSREITPWLFNWFGSGNMLLLPFPNSGDNLDISDFTMESGEPGASCTGSPLSHSAWVRIIHPGGTLVIDTAYATGSAFNSVVQLFADNTSALGALTELGCDNNSGGGSGGNDAKLTMLDLVSASYYVRITCIASCGGTTDLALSLTYTPNEPVPVHNVVDAAAPLQFGTAAITHNVEHATVSSIENSTLGCDMYYSIWYRTTVRITGTYSFSTFGSFLNRANGGINTADTVLAVYRSGGGAVFANFTELGCNDDYTYEGFSALPAVELIAGQDIFVRIGSHREANMLDGSYYRLKTSVVALSQALFNANFETGTLAPWTMTTTGPNEGIWNSYAIQGSFSARMFGAPNKVNTLKQRWIPGSFSIMLPKYSTAVVFFSYSTNGTTSNAVKARIKAVYSDGTPPSFAQQNLNSRTLAGDWDRHALQVSMTDAPVANITFMVKNKSTSGVVYIDWTTLRVFGDPARDAKSAPGVLPLPATPSDPLTLRGQN